MNARLCAALLLTAALLLFGISGDLPARSPSVPETAVQTLEPGGSRFPDKHWARATVPERLGWSSDKLEQAKQFAALIGTASLLVVYDGVVVAESGDVTKRYKLHSVRKSLLSALYGIAVDRGQIDINKTLAEVDIDDVSPSLTDTEKQARISDLLKARSGVYHPAAYETRGMRKRRPERGSHLPGTHWYYNNWDFNALLTIYEQHTGTNVFDDFKRLISDPLNMQDFRLEDTRYKRSRVSIHPAYLFRMSARDLARFGLLYLRNGRWKDKQIISEEWIRESTQAYSRTTAKHERSHGYGYMWWVGAGTIHASGTGGQKLYVMPDQKLVIVHRVDTDIKGNRVKSSKIHRLLDMILEAQIPG